jgi:hypothetical protein
MAMAGFTKKIGFRLPRLWPVDGRHRFQAGVERLGAKAKFPTVRAIREAVEMMIDLQTTVLIALPPTDCCWRRRFTAGVCDTSKLRRGIFGSVAGANTCGPGLKVS